MSAGSSGPDAAAYWLRRVGRHGVLAAGSVALFAFIYAFIPTDFTMRRLSLASAFTAVGWLGLSLVIGPWRQLVRRRRPPAHVEWRRDVGIWAALVAVFHVVVGLQVHMAGQPIRYFLYPPGEDRGLPLRLDMFGWANLTGLFTTAVLVMLLAISNDAALRRLGTPRWKAMQRWNYAAFALVGLHGVMYQILEERPMPVVAVFVAGLLAVTALQLAGYRQRRMMREGA